MAIYNNFPPISIKELSFTEEETAQLNAAKKKPITFDEDCPGVTPERAARFKRVNPRRYNNI